MKNNLLIGIGLIVASSSLTAQLVLDFRDQNLESELTNPLLRTMSYGIVVEAADSPTGQPIYAQIRDLSGNYAPSPDIDKPPSVLSGSVNSDVRINLIQNRVTRFQLSLFSDSGYTTLFDPGPTIDYSFNLAFYDIDGKSSTDNGVGQFFDRITMYTGSSYEYSTTTELVITDNPDGSVTFSGVNAGAVPGQQGIFNLDSDQEDVSAIFSFTNTPQVIFDYENVWTDDNNIGSERSRNLLFDGGGLTFAPTANTTIGVVPEPGTFLGAGFAIVLIALRQLRRENYRRT